MSRHCRSPLLVKGGRVYDPYANEIWPEPWNISDDDTLVKGRLWAKW